MVKLIVMMIIIIFKLIDQPNNTLTLQEFGTITFNIGPTKTQRGYINSSGLNVNNILNVSGTTTLNNAVTCIGTLNVVGNLTTSGVSVFNINSNLNTLSSYSYLNLLTKI